MVNGTLFAPPDDDGFDHVTKVQTNTGVVTSSMLKSHTARYIMNMYPRFVDVDSESLVGANVYSLCNTIEPLEEIVFVFDYEISQKSFKCVQLHTKTHS